MSKQNSEKVKKINESISFLTETAETLRRMKKVKLNEPYCKTFLDEAKNILEHENKQ
jgi:hypothetical protein